MAVGSVYRGAPGSTRKVEVHYTCPCGTMLCAEVYRSVDVSTHPEVGQRLLAADPGEAVNTVICPTSEAPMQVSVPVVYHDPDRRLFVLVLPESCRHRELAERVELLRALDADPAPVPGYVRDFAVVFGAAELRALIEGQGEGQEGQAERAAQEDALEERLAEIERREQALERTARELDERARSLSIAERALAQRQAAQRQVAQRQAARDQTHDESRDEEQAGSHEQTQVVRLSHHESTDSAETNPFSLFDRETLEAGAVEPDGDDGPELDEEGTRVVRIDELERRGAAEPSDSEAGSARLAHRDSQVPTEPRGRRRLPRSEPISSTGDVAVSGTIAGSAGSWTPRNLSSEELLGHLQQDERRVEAAIELARRREPRAIAPVMAALDHMDRRDAVRVLSAAPGFGDAVTSALVDKLRSRKGFVRQGCALALAVLKNETALEALSDQVIAEPTAIWKEIARGIGTAGPSAIMPLASRLSGADDRARERVAWALAHIAACGGAKQVRQLASGRDPIAAGVARHALELVSFVQSDDLNVRGRHTPKEQTVNRAFSRKFFQALEASTPVVDASATLEGAEVSSPAMVLDEADFLETSDYDDDGAELLDENDLLPT